MKAEKENGDEGKAQELLDINDEGKTIPQKHEKEEVSKNKRSAIPIIILIILALAVFIGFLYYRHINNPINKPRRCIVFGFGAVAMSTLPLINKHLKISRFVIVDKKDISEQDLQILQGIKYELVKKTFTVNNLSQEVSELVQDNDIVLDLFGCVDTLTILKSLSNKKGIVYIDSSNEEWDEFPSDSLYEIYYKTQQLKKEKKIKFTSCIESGANPGMITHFARLGLFSMAKSAIQRKVHDKEIIEKYLNEKNVKKLAEVLQVDAIHISEHDTLEPSNEKDLEGFYTNTWCIPSFQEEVNQRCEVSVGNQDKEFFEKNPGYDKITYTNPLGVKTPLYIYMKSIEPREGQYTGLLVRHPEEVEIAEIMSTETHVPTVAFVYKPTRLARKSIEIPNWKELPQKLITEEIVGPLSGAETMGATLISSRKDIPPRIYSSVITAQQGRDVGCTQDPTTLQVAAGLLAHLTLAIKEPEKGISYPSDFDSEEIIKIARPYLGTIYDMDYNGNLSTKWEELLSTKDAMNTDL